MQDKEKFRLNTLMRKIIKKKYNDNYALFARAIGSTKQAIYLYYNNKKQLGWRYFYKMCEKTKFGVKISIIDKSDKNVYES